MLNHFFVFSDQEHSQNQEDEEENAQKNSKTIVKYIM